MRQSGRGFDRLFKCAECGFVLTAAAPCSASSAARTLVWSTAIDTRLAVGETVILLHPPLPLAGVSTVMERERQQNDRLVNGYTRRSTRTAFTFCWKRGMSQLCRLQPGHSVIRLTTTTTTTDTTSTNINTSTNAPAAGPWRRLAGFVASLPARLPAGDVAWGLQREQPSDVLHQPQRGLLKLPGKRADSVVHAGGAVAQPT